MDTNETVNAKSYTIAGFWRRVGAFMLDGLLLGLAGFLLGLFLFDAFAAMGALGRVVGFGIALAYFGVLNSRLGGGQTIGKRLLGIRVIGPRGEGLAIGRSLARYSVLGVPYFLNGAPLGTAVLEPAIGVPLSVLVFGGLGAIAYLLVFNRATRQSLHDLAVGSYVVVSDADAGITPRDRVWRGHLAVVAILVVGSAFLPLLLSRLIPQDMFAGLGSLYTALAGQPEVQNAEVNVGTRFNFEDGERRQTSYVSARLRLHERSTEDQALAERLGRLIVASYPQAEPENVISVVLAYGYDIGIATAWVSHAYSFDPDELSQE